MRGRAWRGHAAWVLVVALALFQCWRFGGHVVDDAYISFRYARRLVQGHGLTWTDGAPVEGYSDLLWVLLVALLDPLGADGLRPARALGVLGAVAALWSVCVDPLEGRHPTLARTLSGGVLLASSASLAAWAVAGLEHTFLAGLVGVGTVALVRSATDGGRSAGLAAALFTAVALTRADGAVLWLGALAGAAVTTPVRAWPRLWSVAVAPAAALAAQEVFRLVTYGDWVPNTARVKVSMTWERTLAGLGWTGRALLAHPGLVLGALAAVALRPVRSPRLWVPAAVAGGWTAYVAWVGGDIFPAWRMLVPALPAFAMLAAEAVGALSPRAAVAATVPLVALHAAAANLGPEIERLAGAQWVWDGRPIGRMLDRAWGERRPLLAVDAAGALPYWSELPSLDLLGLNDAWLPRHPPPGFGAASIGHDLGNGDYTWRRKPDLLVFRSAHGSEEPRFVGSRQLVRLRRFDEFYQLVHVRVPASRGEITVRLYVRREDGPLAVERSQQRVLVPSWFLASRPETPARQNRDGVLKARIGPDLPAVVPSLPLSAGTWTGSGDGVTVELRPHQDDVAAPGEAVLRLDFATKVDVVVRPATEDTRYAPDVVLERVDQGGWTASARPVARLR